jgi:hypothetical protein
VEKFSKSFVGIRVAEMLTVESPIVTAYQIGVGPETSWFGNTPVLGVTD